MNYEYLHLSENINYLNDIAEGKSDFCKILNKAKKPLIIIGNSAINEDDGEEVLGTCAHIAKKYNIINKNFNGFNILQQDISKVVALELGFFNNNFSKNFKAKLKNHIAKNNPLIFLLGSDEIDRSFFENSFVVYLGHHGDESAQFADIILPTPAYTEKSSTFINLEGRVLQTSRCFHPLNESKEEWKIFRALSNHFTTKLKFNNLSELREEISNKYPFLNEINSIREISNVNFESYNEIKSRIIKYNIKSFYMTDSITRSSITMSNCSREILNEVA